MKRSGNTILVTGGTSGIGLEMARALMAAGNTVIIAGRRVALLQAATANMPGMIGLPLDMTDAAGIADFAARLVKDYPELNVVINNAGIMQAEDMADPAASLAIAEATITTNLLGPIRLIAHMLPQLRGRRRRRSST